MKDLRRVCQRCGGTFERKLKGPEPKRCPDCREDLKRSQLNKLRESAGKPPVYDVPDPKAVVAVDTEDLAEPVEEPELPLEGKVEDEPTWLDDPNVQAQLAERNRAKIADELTKEAEDLGLYDIQPEDPYATKAEVPELPKEVDGATGPVDVPETTWEQIKAGQEAVFGDPEGRPWSPSRCIVPDCYLNPDHVGRFCLNHWLRVPLEVRSTLLGAEDGSPPFNSALHRAIRTLRP